MPSPRPNPFSRILIAPDKFKGTLTCDEAARAIGRGLRRAWPRARTTLLHLADGGEGFMELMVRQTGGRRHAVTTLNAAGRRCRAEWGELGGGSTAVIGLANASGIAALSMRERNPEQTSNAGTGQIIAQVLEAGYREIVVGLGGSATTEGGISLATAIGYQFLDGQGAEIQPTGAGLAGLARIVPPAKLPKARFVVAVDVDVPLFGPRGAAHQFAPQKGADAAMVARLDRNLRRLARIVKRDLGCDFSRTPGAGAAGGCGYGLMTFFRARPENGFQLVRRLTGLDAQIRAHDLVVTGEGAFDRTSLHGKAPAQLADLARKLKRPAWAFCGRLALPPGRTPFDQIGALSTPRHPGPPPETLSTAEHAKRLEELAFATARLVQA